MLAPYLMAASAAIALWLGLMHLLYTFRGNKFDPRDPALKTGMQAVSPVITRQTTMWKAWVGFNATHSMGAILFGWMYGYLALAHAEMLFRSPFLLGTGLVMLAAYAVLAKLYFFSVPFRGIVASLGLFVAAVVVRFVV